MITITIIDELLSRDPKRIGSGNIRFVGKDFDVYGKYSRPHIVCP